MFQKNFQLSLIGLILLYSQLCSSRCPTLNDTNVKNIDLSELDGKWYVVAASPVRQNVSKCLHFDISFEEPNSFKMNFTSADPLSTSNISWRVAGREKGNDIIEFWQMNRSPNVYGPFLQKMLAMDSNNSCAMIICTDDNPAMYRNSFGMIWSRTKTLPDTDLLSLKKKIAEYINETDIVDVENLCMT